MFPFFPIHVFSFLGLVKLYLIIATFQAIGARAFGYKTKDALLMGAKLWMFVAMLRPKQYELMYRNYFRAERIAELDEEDHNLIEANKEVSKLLGPKK
jgi:hypothetical protein